MEPSTLPDESASAFNDAYQTERASYITRATADSPDIGIRVVLHTFVYGSETTDPSEVKNAYLDALKPLREKFLFDEVRNEHVTRVHHWDSDAFTVLPFHTCSDSWTTGVKVIVLSPIFRNQTWKIYIPKLMDALRLIPSFEVSFNEHTPLYVQISLGDEPFPANDLKKISKAVIIFEDRLSAHHPNAHNLQYQFCGRNKYFGEIDTTADKIQEIERQSEYGSAERLALLMNPDQDDSGRGRTEGFAGSLEGIIRNRGRPGTKKENYGVYFHYNEHYYAIEFRQAAGTLDAEWTLDWIERVILFTTQAIKTSDSCFLNWAKNRIENKDIYLSFGVQAPKGVTDFW